jgi:hypothetical protein
MTTDQNNHHSGSPVRRLVGRLSYLFRLYEYKLYFALMFPILFLFCVIVNIAWWIYDTVKLFCSDVIIVAYPDFLICINAYNPPNASVDRAASAAPIQQLVGQEPEKTK